MLGNENQDEGEIALMVAGLLEVTVPFKEDGWKVEAWDFGEIEITTPSGQKFTLSIEDRGA